MSEADQIPVILVEDDPLLRESLSEYLGLSGFEVQAVDTGTAYREALDASDFAVAVIDLGLPDVDGSELVEWTRQGTDASVIVLTARNTPAGRIGAYQHGADIFLAKPVEGIELAAAIRSLSRRFLERRGGATAPLTTGENTWKFDPHLRKLVTPMGLVLPITTKEGALLDLLVGANGKPVSRYEISRRLYGRDDESGLAALNTLIGRLRQKIASAWKGDCPVMTEHGVGYRYAGH